MSRYEDVSIGELLIALVSSSPDDASFADLSFEMRARIISLYCSHGRRFLKYFYEKIDTKVLFVYCKSFYDNVASILSGEIKEKNYIFLELQSCITSNKNTYDELVNRVNRFYLGFDSATSWNIKKLCDDTEELFGLHFVTWLFADVDIFVLMDCAAQLGNDL